MSKYPEIAIKQLIEPFFSADRFVRLLLLYHEQRLLDKVEWIDTFLKEQPEAAEVCQILLQAQSAQFGYQSTADMSTSEQRDFLEEADWLVAPMEPAKENLYRSELAAFTVFAVAFHHLVSSATVNYEDLSIKGSLDVGSLYASRPTFWAMNTTSEHKARAIEGLIIGSHTLFDDPLHAVRNHRDKVFKIGHFYATVAKLSANLTE